LLHLLDANVLITANRLYYPLERVPEFWDWLVHQGETGNVKMPLEMVEEITGSADNLSTWLSEKANLDALLLDEDTDVALVRRVTNEGYAPDLTDVEIEKIGRDPFVIAAAFRSPDERLVVTTEVSKPAAQRANRKVPDVCNSLGVRWMNSFELISTLDFTTSWRGR
jgi:hypothetical protein